MVIFKRCVYELRWHGLARNSYQFQVYRCWLGGGSYTARISYGRNLWTRQFQSLEGAKVFLRKILSAENPLEVVMIGAMLVHENRQTWREKLSKIWTRFSEWVNTEGRSNECK